MMPPSVTQPTSLLVRAIDPPRLVEAVVGRLLELVVYSVESTRDRLRGRTALP